MSISVRLLGIAALALAVSAGGAANALFLKSTLKKVKETAKTAVKKVDQGFKKTGDAIKGAGQSAITAVKKGFEKARAGVVNFGRKIQARGKDLWKWVKTRGGKLFYEYLPGKYARLHKDLLRKNQPSTPGLDGSGAGGGAAAIKGTAAGSSFMTVSDNPAVPDAIKKYEAWYNYEAGTVQPAQSVSRRDKQSLVGDQGTRGTCVAFATTAAMEALAGRSLLSKEYTYWLLKNKDKDEICKSEGINMKHAADTITTEGIPREVHYVYLPWQGFEGAKLCPAGPTGLAKKLATYKAKNVYYFPWRQSGKGAALNNPRFIEAAIDAGYEIVGSFDVAFLQEKAKYFHDAVVDPDTKAATEAPGGHAMLVVGYDRTGKEEHGGGHIIVKNSWTALWEDGGYTKLSYDYVRQYAGSSFIIGGIDK